MKHERVRRPSNWMERLCLAPYSVWAAFFIVVPLIFVAYYAFTDSAFHFTFDNITRFFTATSTITDENGQSREVHTYLLIFMRSLKLAVISTVICLIMGYPAAYIISKANARTQSLMITLIMISFSSGRDSAIMIVSATSVWSSRSFSPNWSYSMLFRSRKYRNIVAAIRLLPSRKNTWGVLMRSRCFCRKFRQKSQSPIPLL